MSEQRTSTRQSNSRQSTVLVTLGAVVTFVLTNFVGPVLFVGGLLIAGVAFYQGSRSTDTNRTLVKVGIALVVGGGLYIAFALVTNLLSAELPTSGSGVS